MKEKMKYILEPVKIVFFALLIVIPIRYFLFQPFIVRGASMEPSFQEADYLIVDQISYRFREPKRGEVIVFRYPNDPQKMHIKRIIGLPGEEVVIDGENIYIIMEDEREPLVEEYIPRARELGSEEIKLREDEYFVMGDNRTSSVDSRTWGSLPEENIIGRVIIQVSPFETLRWVGAPEYSQ